MQQDPIKEAFDKVKQDMQILSEQIQYIHQEIEEIKRTMYRQTIRQTDRQINQTYPELVQTQDKYGSNNMPLEAVKSPISSISTGNRGVQTDRQTIRQTDRHTENRGESTESDPINQLQKVSEIIASLDQVKKELRLQFKKLTNQEMAVFVAIYQLEEKALIVDYPLLAKKLSLSESSIRDYITRIIEKGIPLIKTKENNKKIILNIAPELLKIANLATIQQLRDI